MQVFLFFADITRVHKHIHTHTHKKNKKTRRQRNSVKRSQGTNGSGWLASNMFRHFGVPVSVYVCVCVRARTCACERQNSEQSEVSRKHPMGVAQLLHSQMRMAERTTGAPPGSWRCGRRGCSISLRGPVCTHRSLITTIIHHLTEDAYGL